MYTDHFLYLYKINEVYCPYWEAIHTILILYIFLTVVEFQYLCGIWLGFTLITDIHKEEPAVAKVYRCFAKTNICIETAEGQTNIQTKSKVIRNTEHTSKIKIKTIQHTTQTRHMAMLNLTNPYHSTIHLGVNKQKHMCVKKHMCSLAHKCVLSKKRGWIVLYFVSLTFVLVKAAKSTHRQFPKSMSSLNQTKGGKRTHF